ncbi:MAG: hypothetical protein U0528_13680 [Anaerolineae bacterium]|nr:hypothetical protein [Anaerolineae bacterium]
MGESRLLFNVLPDVHIEIENIGADAVIEGYDGQEVLITGEDVQIERQSQEQVVLEIGGDCKIRIPLDATLTLSNISGDAVLRDIQNEIQLDSVGGSLQVRNVHGLHVDSVGGDLQLKNIEGDVQIDSVGGDAEIKNVAGDVNIDSVGGDVLLRGISVDAHIENVGGDLILETQLHAENDHAFGDIGGDIVIKVGEDSDVRFILPKDADRSIKLRNATIQTEDDEEVIMLAEGNGTVKIENVGGTILLRGSNVEGEEIETFFEEMIPDSEEIEEAVRSAEEARMQWERERERAQREAERAHERAQRQHERETERISRQVERAQREAERAAERAKERMRNSGFNFSFDFGKDKFKNRIRIPVSPIPPMPPNPPAPPAPPRAPGYAFRGAPPPPPVDPVTDEERMMILRMVENKQISVEEAERLFAALEGRDQQKD